MTTVPDLVGLTQSAALDRLTNAGLQMATQFVNLSPDDPRIGIVITQDPAAGVKADAGLTVTVVIGQSIDGGTTPGTGTGNGPGDGPGNGNGNGDARYDDPVRTAGWLT